MFPRPPPPPGSAHSFRSLSKSPIPPGLAALKESPNGTTAPTPDTSTPSLTSLCSARQGLGASPAQLLLGRQTRTLLPARPERLRPEWRTDQSHSRIQREQRKQKKSYDKRARDLPALSRGDRVLFRPTGGGDRPWRKGVVVTEHSPRSYVIRDQYASDWRRNRRDLRADVLPELPADPLPGVHRSATVAPSELRTAAAEAPSASPAAAAESSQPPLRVQTPRPAQRTRTSPVKQPSQERAPPVPSPRRGSPDESSLDEPPAASRDAVDDSSPPVPPRRSNRTVKQPDRLCYV